MHPLGNSLISMQIHVGAKFVFDLCSKRRGLSSPEVYGSISEKFARKKYGLKNTAEGG